VRDLNQDAGPIACLRIAASRAAVCQVDQNLKTLADDLMALLAANAGDQPHSAGIMLIPWMIETLRLRGAETTIRFVRCVHGNLFDERFSVRCALPCRKDTDATRFPSRDIAMVFHEKACRSSPGRVWD
jgi:hypothetical protein